MPDASRRPDPFALDIPLQSRLARAAFVAARPLLSRVLGLEALRDLYERSASEPGDNFERRVLEALRIGLQVTWQASVPATGPLIVVANHPTGALDGLVAAAALREVRPDVRVLANHLLARIPELAESCFFVDPFAGPAAAARSQAGLRAAHLWLRRGGALIVFPSGEVASTHEAQWQTTAGRLALATRARIVPVLLEGENSRTFYAVGRVHPCLRSALLGRELLNKRGTTARVSVGSAIDTGALGATTAAELTARAHEAVMRLARPSPLPAIAPAVPPALLAQDINALGDAARLLASGPLEVYCAGASALPHVLQEIGRLRELTFRAVGEGTGNALDFDRFDEHYEHLFVWNRDRHEVVGAYRIGATDRIVAAHGIDGLYTSTLFRFDERLLGRMGPALELGRSFVRAEYQRSYSALLLLWRGIGCVLGRDPRYAVLFGPVSISSRYGDTSQQLLRAFLAQNHGATDVENLLSAVMPPPPIAAPAREAIATANVDELDTLIRRLEGTQGIPVLLRQYMRLNATLLGFNIDPAFGGALDALMMVNIHHLPASIRARYLGVPSSTRCAA
ncbi:MAG TPA: lysophospholipid acyltransferase family protein [Vicinamibacterales bacterium]|nr:lysophospholipid acyltransferase family protein [Vicinamibacterales bacterium]